MVLSTLKTTTGRNRGNKKKDKNKKELKATTN